MEQDSSSEQGPVDGSQRAILLTDPHHTKADLRLIRRAIENGWNVAAEEKTRIVDRLMGIIDDKAAEDKNIIGAARTLVAADGADQKFQAVVEKTEEKSQVNVQVNVVNRLVPITESERMAEALALLDRARARAIADAGRAADDEVRTAQANGEAVGIPSP